MPTTTLYTLEASNITVSGGGSLSGVTQGDGSHLMGQTITLGSNAWASVDVADNDANFQDNDSGQTLDGAQTYDGVSYANGTIVEAEYTLTVQDPDGNTYTVIGFNLREPGAANPYGTTEGLAFVGPVGGFPPHGVALTVIGASEGPTGSTTPFSSYATPPCFTPGTRIETDRGLVLVEDIVCGDLVRTLDDGFQPVRWVGRSDIAWRDLWEQPRLRPVVIAKGALGAGMPRREMRVSPMHRVLQSGPQAELLFGSGEVLIPAVHLVDGAGIRRDMAMEDVSYIHIAFDRHQIVQSDGIWSESFLPGAVAVSGLQRAVRDELELIFPGASTGQTAQVAARPCLKGYEAKVFVTLSPPSF